MPNWCSNRMHFSGEPAQIAEIKRLASGAVTPLYRRATNEGIQLFLAGSAGLLQITENIRSEQCPGVTAAGRGAVSTENIAFTRWLTIIRVNKSNGAVSSVTTPNYSFLGYSGTMKVTPDRITDYKAPSAEEAAVASQAAKRPPVVNYPGEGFREMTKAQWAALPRDCKAVRSVAEAEDHGAYRYRRTMDNNFRLVNVYITDMKITEIPQK